MNGQTVFTYHARAGCVWSAGDTYRYSVTADNDSRSQAPLPASFRVAKNGRFPVSLTSFGDLATPASSWTLSSPQSRHAVDAVERFEPLFHLLNGDLCYANLNPAAQPAVWADFGNNVQRSAAYRPWMPCPGNHEIEFHNGSQGLDSYLTRYALPDNGTPYRGRWYCFKVGSALFISLAADDVIYQDSGAFHAGPQLLLAGGLRRVTRRFCRGRTLYVRGYGSQRLYDALARAERWRPHTANTDVDWIIVQMHQDAPSSIGARQRIPTV